MAVRKLHRIAGIVMLLPLLGWAVTGAVFFLKPGYSGAYETLPVKSYPLETEIKATPDPAWLEVRFLKTILGEHLLARTSRGWLHYDPRVLQLRNDPSTDEVRALVNDAISANPARYGQIIGVEGGRVITDTGIRIDLDWSRLTLSQRGADTDRIDALYKIHYLQWTGMKWVDQVLGALGILLVVSLSALGASLFFRRG
jgi:PepSY-associated TM region